jgi:hypothetical protein
MQVFVFQSGMDRDITGFTADRSGRNLPAEYGPWKPIGNSAQRISDHAKDAASDANMVLGGIARDGYFLTRAAVHVTSHPIPHGHA